MVMGDEAEEDTKEDTKVVEVATKEDEADIKEDDLSHMDLAKLKNRLTVMVGKNNRYYFYNIYYKSSIHLYYFF